MTFDFAEYMWQIQGRNRRLPTPWYAQQFFRSWTNNYRGPYSSVEDSFSGNALYRYWNMIGVKDRKQECLIGQSGEIQPVSDGYTLNFSLFDPVNRTADYPQYPNFGSAVPALTQAWTGRYLPLMVTTWDSRFNRRITQTALATTIGQNGLDFVLVRFNIAPAQGAGAMQLLLSVTPYGPAGYRIKNKAGQIISNVITTMDFDAARSQLRVNGGWGPTFDGAPNSFGLYGNGGQPDVNFTQQFNPYEALLSFGALSGDASATDNNGGFCQAGFLWDVPAGGLNINVRLPIGDFRSQGDVDNMRGAAAADCVNRTTAFWTQKLDVDGPQITLPPVVAHLVDLFKISRATILTLADNGEIHPGPTLYDSFWIRDSSVEGIACALSGDADLAQVQFGTHYTAPGVFHQENGNVGPASIHGFFGTTHEIENQEWDSNGEALWAIGRFDRIRGSASNFGAGMFNPYVLDGARWIRDNRSQYGLLLSGWSAEHLGNQNKPHYWDDFWGIAGLWEAGQLANRIGAAQAAEIWSAYDSLWTSTRDSILFILNAQRQAGRWETYIPTGPDTSDIPNSLNSTMIGAMAYFHPCRLHIGQKLGSDVDGAARSTLDTIFGHFVQNGGFRHDASWGAYGPYLTTQLAHACLFIGRIDLMDQCLSWIVANAGYARLFNVGAASPWSVIQGAWNEQHCYPISLNFPDPVDTPWYMGDIPHGWAAAEFILLLRDIMFFEADEDIDPQIYIAPGIVPNWIAGGGNLSIANAPTSYGMPFGYTLTHDANARRVTIDIAPPPIPNVRYIFPWRIGITQTITVDGAPIPVAGGMDNPIPAGAQHIELVYQ